MIISAFSALVGMGGAPLASIKMGENNMEGAQKILGNATVLLLIVSAILTAVFLILTSRFSLHLRREQGYHRLCNAVYDNLCVRDSVCPDCARSQRLYHRAGRGKDQYDDGADWRGH